MTPEQLKAFIEQQLTKQRTDVDALILKTTEDIKKHGEIQEDTKQKVAEANAKGQEIYGKFIDFKKTCEDRILELEQKLLARHTPMGGKAKSPGAIVVESDQFKAFAQKAKGAAKITSDPIELKTITSLAGSGGLGIWSQRLPGVIEEPFQPLGIRDLLDNGTTDSNLIEWVRENVFTNAAHVVSEGTTKPQSDITYERLDVPVRTIAHWIRATKQVLADFKQLMTMINGRLSFGLKLVEEREILFGDGTGEHLLGLVPQATPYSHGSYDKANDTMIDTIRHAILQVRLAFYPANGIVLSPTDWHNMELTKDSQNRYMMASPTARTPPMVWGLPVVEIDSMEVGDFLVGSFNLAATLFDREQAQILVSTEDQDNFIKNLVTILCEERLALAVTRPKAFVYGDFPAGATT